jgi:uncharacterized protein (DUF1800 family)
MRQQDISKFTRRVAFGIRGDQSLPDDPLTWAIQQLGVEPPIDIIEPDGSRRSDLPADMKLLSDIDDVMHAFATHQRVEKESFEKAKTLGPKEYEAYREETVATPYWRLTHWKEVQARETTALFGGAPVFERFWHFWTNHFMVAPGNQNNDTLIGPFQRSLRPLMLGNYRDMLWHAVTHPAMLVYLDNNRNTGPRSRAAREKWTKDSINENLGRELLELFTLSPSAGYTQKDVEGTTLILTGWRDMKPDQWHKGQPLGTYFDFNHHEPGSQEVLGKRYTALFKPSSKLEDLVTDLANHPATARHLAHKLCVYFIDDTPPAAAVDKVESAFIGSKGDLQKVHQAVIEAAWAHLETTRKFVSPETWLLQVWTVSGAQPPRTIPITRSVRGLKTPYLLGDLGQEIPRCPQPNGWPIRSVDWISKEMLDRRLRVLSVLGGEERRAGRALDMRVNVSLAAARDLHENSPARSVFKQADTFNDARLGLIAFFASPEILWS